MFISKGYFLISIPFIAVGHFVSLILFPVIFKCEQLISCSAPPFPVFPLVSSAAPPWSDLSYLLRQTDKTRPSTRLLNDSLSRVECRHFCSDTTLLCSSRMVWEKKKWTQALAYDSHPQPIRLHGTRDGDSVV